ncbi:hypothetical protein R1sor_001666 [Riccia sorocarpa]|uniref:Acid phosphatase n=1 Tax=Riccia sorocarpa TaxID=122646 RepID=A0ABD3H2H3_9MARC
MSSKSSKSRGKSSSKGGAATPKSKSSSSGSGGDRTPNPVNQVYKSSGGQRNFMHSYGLKMHNHGDVEESKSIAEAFAKHDKKCISRDIQDPSSLILSTPEYPTGIPKSQSMMVLSGRSVAATLLVAAVSLLAITVDATPLWFDRIYVLIFENTDYSAAIADPNFSKWAANGKLLTNYHGVAHPSQPNYIAMVAGSTLGVTTDGNVNLSNMNLVDLLEAAGVSWRSYSENYTQLSSSPNCNLATTIGSATCPNSGSKGKTNLYARKHNPLISFTDVQTSSSRCNNIVPATNLAVDKANNAIPQVVLYVPNQCNDGHDPGVTYAGRFLDNFMTSTFTGNAITGRTLVVITFDENSGTSGNQIYTALVPFGSLSITVGSTDNTNFNHYSLLKTIEQNFGTGNLGLNDVTASAFNFP